jgi:hypothetical protein
MSLSGIQPGWLNGTAVLDSAADKVGKIVFVVDRFAPYDRFILREIKAGAKAVVFLRERSGDPGQTMFLVDGSDQKGLTVPCVEIFQSTSVPGSIAKNFPAEGLEVSIWPQENKWKTANDKTAFQVFFNVFNSACELLIISISIIRLSQWFRDPETKILSIGPICITLELVSAVLKLAYTIVDPFWTFRMMPDNAASVMLTVSLPFQFSSGILLAFFWAETLSANRVKASPFVSEYKKSAFVVIAILFIGEISTDVARLVIGVSSFNPSFISQAFYAVTAAVLTVCYVICAVKILKRLGTINQRKRYVRNMTLRFVGSTVGYVAFIILIILLIPLISYPWPFKLLLNLMFVAANGSALLQVYSFKARSKSASLSSAAGRSQGDSIPSPGRSNSARTNYSRVGKSARQEHEEDPDDDTSSGSSSSSTSRNHSNEDDMIKDTPKYAPESQPSEKEQEKFEPGEADIPAVIEDPSFATAQNDERNSEEAEAETEATGQSDRLRADEAV